MSLIAAGFKRYGFHDEANRLCGRMFEASQHFAEFRLPELFCGFDRDVSPVPVPYPVACSPQAWAAGSIFLFLETMLGLRPHADGRRAGARAPGAARVAGQGHDQRTCGSATAEVDLLFHRWRGGTSAEVIRKSQDLVRHDPDVARGPCLHRRRAAAARDRAAGGVRLGLGAAGRGAAALARRSAWTGRASSPTREAPVGEGAREAFEAAVARRERGEPIAYIRGFREFHGLAFATDGRALIPRPETEHLVDAAVEEVAARLAGTPRASGAPALRVADVGTGTGAIAVSLLAALRRRRMADEVLVIAIDVSEDALQLARENAVGHGVADRIVFVAADLLPYHVDPPYTIVCANLPYVPSGEIAGPRPGARRSSRRWRSTAARTASTSSAGCSTRCRGRSPRTASRSSRSGRGTARPSRRRSRRGSPAGAAA